MIVSSRLKVLSLGLSKMHGWHDSLSMRGLVVVAFISGWGLLVSASHGQDSEETAKTEETNQNVEVPIEVKKSSEVKKNIPFSIPDTLPVTGLHSVLGEQVTRPDAIYLRRENGDSVFVPQLRYEDFERYLNQQTQLSSSELPTVVFEGIKVTGEIKEGFADVEIECRVVLPAGVKKLVEIELALGNCNIQAMPATIGGSKSLLYPNKSGNGFVWALEPDGSSQYSIRIRSLLKVDRVGLDSSLRFELPSGPSRLELKIPSNANRPAANLQWDGKSGEVLQSVDQPPFVMATIVGRGGSGALNWNEGLEQPSLGVIEAESDTRFLLNRQSLRWDVASKVRLRSTGRRGPQDIIFELPENAVWIPSQVAGVQTMWTLGNAPAVLDETIQAPSAVIDPKKPSAGNNSQRKSSKVKQQRLLLRLSERARGFTEEIPIEWRLPISDKSEQEVTLASPSIVDAQRHEGRIAVEVPSEQQFSWSSTSELQFLNQTLEQDNKEYEFRFSRQGGFLEAVLRTDKAQARLKSIYLATLNADQVQLNAVYQFTQPPSSLQELTFDAPGWNLHGLSWVETSDLIPADALNDSVIRVVPGALSNPGTSISGPDSKSIRLLATRPVVAEKGTTMSFGLPLVRWLKSNREQVQERGDGWLYVSPGPFKVLSESTKLTAMTKTNDGFESFQSSFKLPAPLNAPLAYRFRSGNVAPRWESPLKLTPRIVAGLADTDFLIRDHSWVVTRRWKLNIEGPDLSRITFRVPRLADRASDEASDIQESPDNLLKWELQLNDMPVAVTTRTDLSNPAFYFVEADMIDASKETTIELSCQLNGLNNSQSEKTPSEKTQVSWSNLRKLPIATLEIDSQSTIQEKPAVMKVEGDLLCEMKGTDGSLKRVTSFDGPVTLPVVDSNSFFELSCLDLKSIGLPAVAVDRAWLQTLTNESQVRQRVVLKAETSERTLAFQIPEAWDPKTLKVIVNGSAVAVLATTTEDNFRCPISSSTSSNADKRAMHVIEFWNWYSLNDQIATRLEPLIPVIEGASRPVSCVWQIAVPSEDILWSHPSDWMADWNWYISDWQLKRVASQVQSDFERDFAASRQPALPRSTNQYVITTVLNDGDRKLHSEQNGVLVVPRFLIWLPIGLTMIASSILWSLSEWFRRPAIWVACCVVLVLIASTASDVGILIGQALVLSLLLIGIVQLCRWAWPVRTRRKDAVTGSPKTSGSTIVTPASKSGNGMSNGIRTGSQPTQLSPVEIDVVTAKARPLQTPTEPELEPVSSGSGRELASDISKTGAIASSMRTEIHRSGSYRLEHDE